MTILIDLTGKGLTLLVLLLAVLFIAWQCLEGLLKVTTIGRGFFNYCINRRNFERWLRAMDEQEEKERDSK